MRKPYMLPLLAAASTLFATTAMAQVQYSPDLGAGLAVGDDSVSDVVLSFPFTFPDGTSTTDIRVDSNGLITPTANGAASDFTESPGDFTVATGIAALWDDLNTPAFGGDVFVSDNGSQANITWVDTIEWGETAADVFSVQLQLHADGRIGFIYDCTATIDGDCIAGVSAGGGTDPGSSDVSTALSSAGVGTVYEVIAAGSNDLNGLAIEFAPDGGGGWNTTVTSGEFYGCCATATTDFGSPIGAGDDSVTDVVLSFPVTFADGTVTTDIRIDSNGRVTPTAAGAASDFSESVGDLLTGAASFNVCWDDQSPQVGDDVYVRDNGVSAYITWAATSAFPGGTNVFTAQLQLHVNGRFAVVYNASLDASEDMIVGVSEGGGAADPGESDLSTALSSAGVTTVYEQFLTGETDLADLSVAFSPDGLGGWDTCVDVSGFEPPPIPGTCTNVAHGCATTITFSPDTLGGYSAIAFTPDLDTNAGTSLGLGDDQVSPAQALGFTFTFPDGTATTDVFVDSNGRILAATTGSDFSPSVAELLAGPTALCPIWLDLSPNIAGDVTFYADPDGNYAAISWTGVPQFDESNSITAQCILRPDGSFSFNYTETTGYLNTGTTGDNLIVGCTAGSGAVDPGESDFAAMPIFSAGPDVYEFWDNDFDDVPDLQPNLECDGSPLLGGDLAATIHGLPTLTTASAFMFLGFAPSTPVDLTGILGWDRCFLTSTVDVPAIPLTLSGSTASFTLALPFNPGFVGLLDINIQGVAVAPGDSGGGDLDILLTDGIDVDF